MSEIICVTNAALCSEPLESRIAALAAAKPKAILLRAKELSPAEYRRLAEAALQICNRYDTQCILHNFPSVAAELHADALHLPLQALRTLGTDAFSAFSVRGASCHSVADAKAAQDYGCTYITCGHIFETDCKKGLPARGLSLLQSVCTAVDIPVYAIGGITPQNLPAVFAAGAQGACVMQGAMRCTDTKAYLEAFTNAF